LHRMYLPIFLALITISLEFPGANGHRLLRSDLRQRPTGV